MKDSVEEQLQKIKKELQYEKEFSEQTSKDKAKIQRDHENEKKLRHSETMRHLKEKNDLEFILMKHQDINMEDSESDSDSKNELKEENQELKAENLELKSIIYKLERAAIRHENEL